MTTISLPTFCLILILRHVRCLALPNLDCATVNVETLVPVLDQAPAVTESVSFAPDLTRLFGLLSTIGDPGFKVHPENEKFITTQDIDICHRLGKPLGWDEIENLTAPSDQFTVLMGYFGRATSGDTANFEACQFGKTTLFGAEQCQKQLQAKATILDQDLQGYGEIDNKVFVLSVKGDESRWLEIGADNDQPIACLATPLTDMITKLQTLSKDVYCLVDEMFSLLDRSEERGECDGIRYQLARHRLLNQSDWENHISEECSKLIKFTCPVRTTRATSIENFVLETINKHGVELLKQTLSVINNILIPRTPEKTTAGWSTAVNYGSTLTNTDLFLAMRLAAKFTQMHFEDSLIYNRMANWATNVLSELKFTVNAILNNYQLLITKLTGNQLSCILGKEALSLDCSSNALLKSFSAGQIRLTSDQLKFKLNSLIYVNCVSHNGINIAGNRQVFLKIDNELINDNYTIPINCLSADTFTTQACNQIFSSKYSENFKIDNEVEIIATDLDKIKLSANNAITVIDKNQKQYFPSKLITIKSNVFPIMISGAGNLKTKISLNTVLNQIGKKFILNQVRQEMPRLRSFALQFSKRQLQLPNTNTWSQFILNNIKMLAGVVAAIGVFIITLVLVLVVIKCRKTCEQNRTNTDGQNQVVAPDCRMPFLRRGIKFDKDKFRKDMMEFLRTDRNNTTTHGNTNPADAKLFNIIVRAVEKAESKAKLWMRSDNKTQHDLIFEIGFMLYSDLADRMCACAFPVHVCVNDVASTQAQHDAVRRMQQYVFDKVTSGPTPSAPDAIEFCN